MRHRGQRRRTVRGHTTAEEEKQAQSVRMVLRWRDGGKNGGTEESQVTGYREGGWRE